MVSYGLGWPNGLTADCDKNMLYWADAKYDKIEVSDLLVGKRLIIYIKDCVHTLPAQSESGKNVTQPDFWLVLTRCLHF